MVACGGLGPAVSPRNVRKTTVMPGNREDRGRQQLDQVSPLDIDSFFPLVSACVRLGDESVSTVSVLQASLDETLGAGGASRTLPALVASVAQRRRLQKVNTMAKTRQSFSETRRAATPRWLDATEDVRRCIWGIQRRHLRVSRNSSHPRRAS